MGPSARAPLLSRLVTSAKCCLWLKISKLEHHIRVFPPPVYPVNHARTKQGISVGSVELRGKTDRMRDGLFPFLSLSGALQCQCVNGSCLPVQLNVISLRSYSIPTFHTLLVLSSYSEIRPIWQYDISWVCN